LLLTYRLISFFSVELAVGLDLGVVWIWSFAPESMSGLGWRKAWKIGESVIASFG